MGDIRELLAAPELALQVPADEARRLLVSLAAVQRGLELAATATDATSRDGHHDRDEGGLLTPAEAAGLLALTLKQLYRRADRLPGVTRLGARTLRFEAAALRAWLRSQGRTARAR